MTGCCLWSDVINKTITEAIDYFGRDGDRSLLKPDRQSRLEGDRNPHPSTSEDTAALARQTRAKKLELFYSGYKSIFVLDVVQFAVWTFSVLGVELLDLKIPALILTWHLYTCFCPLEHGETGREMRTNATVAVAMTKIKKTEKDGWTEDLVWQSTRCYQLVTCWCRTSSYLIFGLHFLSHTNSSLSTCTRPRSRLEAPGLLMSRTSFLFDNVREPLWFQLRVIFMAANTLFEVWSLSNTAQFVLLWTFCSVVTHYNLRGFEGDSLNF